MPGTLVLKTMAIYVEYLRGYTQDGDGPEHADDDDEQAALLAAFALGLCDQRSGSDGHDGGRPLDPRRPRELREVLPIVRRMIEAEPITAD